jgi:hypothetical protein
MTASSAGMIPDRQGPSGAYCRDYCHDCFLDLSDSHEMAWFMRLHQLSLACRSERHTRYCSDTRQTSSCALSRFDSVYCCPSVCLSHQIALICESAQVLTRGRKESSSRLLYMYAIAREQRRVSRLCPTYTRSTELHAAQAPIRRSIKDQPSTASFA